MMLSALVTLQSAAFATNIIHEFYVPMPEAQVRTALVTIEPATGIVGTNMESVISIVVTGTGTVIHYDEWEDGYEVDLNNPAQSTTKIWGDGNDANGIPPGYAHDPASMPSGSVINLRNQIPLPRNPATILYDGRDRFGGTKALVVTRTGWAVTPGTVLAGSVEVTATMDYGTQYVSPVGQDVSANSMFEYVGLMVLARENGTSVTVDLNGPVSGGATTITLNQGESYLANGGVLKGATVTATKPVQTQLITGDIGARYETDWFTLYPVDQWTGTYYSPVGTASNGDATLGFFYNPTGSALTVNVVTGIGTGSFSIPANGVYQYQMPQNVGAKFTSVGEVPFLGIVTVGANPTANNVHDWGFTLVPSDSLTTEAVVGWGPGSSDLTQNGSPVWVTPIAATRIYVDYNGDRNGALTDPKGNKYDVHYDLAALATKLIYDPDKDQSAMRVYTLDGTPIAAAWGQDPATAGPGNPFLDVGTTVLPFPVPTLVKSFSMITDTAPTGLSIGDTIEYRIDVDNKGLLPLGNLLVLDPLNPSLTYVASSTKRDGVTIPDGGTGTPFPLDESGYVIPIILRGGNTTFTYRCTINSAGSINNTASNTNYNLVSTTQVVVPPPAGSTPCGAQFTNAAGAVQTAYSAGSLIYATLTDPDANNNIAAVENITIVVNNTTNGDAEFVTLVETGANTGIFRNTTGLATSTTSGSSQMDGTLLVSPANSLSFTYTDPEFNETCSGGATISVPTQSKYLYLSDPSQALDRVDPVASSDGTTAQTSILTAPSVGGGTVTLNPSKDTWIGSANTTFNYGSSTTLSLDRAGGSVGNERSLLQFDLSSIPPGAIITSAQLSLTKTGGSIASQNVDVYRATATWDEGTQNGAAGTASWSQRQSATNWTTAGGDFNGTAEATVPVAANGVYTWNIASLVQSWYSGSVTNNGVLLGSPDTGGTQSQQFASRENGTVGSRPQLVVEYTTIAAASTSSSSTVSGNTLSFSHTPGSGSNRLLLVAVGTGATTNSGNGGTITGVTYNSVAMTLVGTVTPPTNTGTRSYLYSLVNPDPGPANVVVTASAACSMGAGATTFTGVDQTTPLGTYSPTSNAASGTASATVTSAVGEIVYSSASWDEGIGNQTITTTAGQTELWNISGLNFASPAASTKPGASSVTVSYTAGDAAQEWAMSTVTVKPVSVPSSPVSFVQTPTFAAPFTIPAASTPTVTAYYSVTSGSMPATPNVTATLKKNSTAVATSTSAAASGGLLTFTFPVLGSAVNFAASDVVTLEITNSQSGVAFTVDYDSTTKPSKITLPTNTVITNTALGVYDAPYPGGSLITGPASGTTVYVRATASDPFGAYDITSMGLNIDGPGASGDITTTLNAGNVVNTTAATKTYEYVWNVGSTTGTYNISTTANEGSEGINATRATSVNVTFLDLGTPSTTEFTTGLNGPGTPTYAGNEQVCVRITDLDQNTDALVAETIQATITALSGDSELITLTETGVNTGVFTFCIPASTTGGVGNNNGTLHAILGEVLTVVYVDPNDSSDTSNDTATIPNIAPAVNVNKTLVSPADGQAVIGEALQYSVVVTNTGNTTLNTISLVDTFLPAKLTYVSASITPNTIASGSLTWTNVGPLAPGQNRTIMLNFTAAGTAAPAVNTATANAGGGVTGGDTANVTITNPSVTISKTLVSPNPGPANINANVVFRITMQNTGDTAIATLPVEDTFSGADFEFVSATQTPDAVGNGSLLWLDVTGAGTLGVGASTTIDITMKAKGAAAPATNLAAANYTVDVNDDSAPPVSSSTTITLIAAKITGHVYDDVNTNVIYNAGVDGFLENTTVSLYTDPNGDGNPADGTLVAMTTSDVNGAYEFLNLAAGNFVIVESQPPGYSSSGDSSLPNDNRIPVVISALTTYSSKDFFDFLTPPVSYASVAGKVWNDANASATVNGGEVGIANVAVDLVEDTNNNGVADLGEPVISSTLTATDGTYSFTGLAAGNYVVVEHDLFNWYSTADSAAPNNNMIPVVLSSGQNATGKDFLDVLTGTSGGKVFRDTNGNGIFDGGDVALANIDVIITDFLGATQTVVTDASGNWTATLPPGLTTIDVQQSDPQFTAVFAPAYGYTQTAGTDSSTVTVVSGVNTSAGDDGFRQLGKITGHLYVDTNGNGTQDGSEPDLANVDVIITKVDLTTMTVTTDASGNWNAFVPPGLTKVDIDNADPQFTALVLTGFNQTEGTDFNNVTAVANATTDAGTDGFFNPCTISGVVSKDTNNDNTADAPHTGVQIKLFTDPNGDGDPADGVQVGVSQNTNGSGAYSFTGLPVGNYVVVMTPPSGYAAIIDGDTTTPGDDVANASLTDARIPVGVVGGETDNGNNFLTEQYGTISGTVLADLNNDDIGDDPIENVTLTLVDSAGDPVDGDPNTSGVQPITTTTDVNGDYSFTNVPPGTYGVKETQPAGYLSVTDTDGGNPNEVRPITVSAGGTTPASFVEEAIATISGYVRTDTDNDDIGDTGVSGVVLTLLDGSGAVIDGDPLTNGVQPITATTNGSGFYSFTNLTPGLYQISEAQPSGYASLGDRDGGDLDIIGDVVARSLDAGETDANNNFDEEQYGTITGTVKKDTDNNDSGDSPISGVVLTLLDFNGAIIDGDLITNGVQPITATTDGSGVYTFSNVPPGDYRIGEAQPSGYQSVSDADGGNLNQIGDVALVTVIAGGSVTDLDFVEEQLGEIRGGVFVGITPLQNVTLALFTDPNGDGDPSDGAQLGSTVQTDVSGLYVFTNVAPGSYVVVQTQPSGYVSVGDGDTTTPGDDATNASQTDNRVPVAIAAGEIDDGNNFTEGCPTITVNPSTLPNGTVGTSYSQTLSATGGTAAYTFAVTTGSLPAGLSLASGVISGTPSSPDNQTFTITATDALGCTGTRSYTVVTSCPTITVNPSSLPSATVGTAYTQTLSATGGTAAYTFAVTTGSLPAGLMLTGDTISGTPTAAGPVNFTITATDSFGCTGTRALTITSICPAITVSPTSLPAAVVGTSYSQQLSASGGTSAYTYAVTTGSLPAGLSLNVDTIEGTPTSTASATFVITATDANGCEGTRSFTLAPTCPTISLSSTPAVLPSGTVGSAYTGAINATGGTAAYTFAVKVGSSLPDGLSISSAGAISGTPTTNGTTNTIIVATDANGCKGEATFTINIGCNTLAVAPGSVSDGVVGTAYTPVVFSQTGGTGVITWSQTGTLPAGMTFNTGTHTFSGTPTEAGTWTITITATDANTCAGSVNLSFSTTCPTITVTPATLPAAVVGTAYSQQLGASGGTSPYTFAVTSGTLPAGLSLGGDTISGTPTSTTSQTFTITATDANGCTGALAFTLAPTCPTVTVTPASLPDGVVGTSYNQSLSGNGGTAPYTFAVTSGALPAGLGLSSGVISGTPTSTSAANFTITATDTHGCTGTRSFTVTPVCPTITVNPSALAAAVVGSAYNDTLSATGGTSPYTFAVTAGALPDGLNLVGSTISGTPTSTTSETFAITATDAHGCTGTRSFTVAPTCPTITVNPASLPAAVVGTSYSQQLSATGGTAPFSYAVTTGTLPDGLALAGDTISGTPTSTTSQIFTITVTDDYGCEGTRSFTLAPTCPTISLSSTPAVLPSGTVGSAYTGAINATGGTAAYTFAVKVGSSLPDGLSIDSAGAITGTPTTNGTTNTIIVATDANGCKGEATFAINVGCNTLAVAPSSVSDGVVGTAYTPVVFNQTGGTGVITWSQTGTLPAGMTFNTGTHTLSGTPTEAGTWTVTIIATDANTCAGSVNLSFSTTCPTITVTPASLPAAVVGTSYSQQLDASGGTAPYTFAVTSGTLPAGLGLAADTISGTPTSTTSQTFTVTATDANGCSGALAFTLAPTCPTITVNPATLPNGVVGTSYNQTLSGSGGTSPYSFAVTSGALPAGLNLVSGSITGTPTSTTAASFTITATDAHGCTGTRSFTVTPTCPTITVNPATLPDATVGSAYSELLSATNGTAPYTFAVTSGSLPAGLSLSVDTITGTATAAGPSTFTITATDAHGCTGTRTLTITSTCPTITVNPATLPNGVVGTAYSQALNGSGGTAPYTFAVTSGALPAGLSLNADTIEGTPTSTSSATFVITATDTNGCSGTRSFTLAPTCPTISLSSTPAILPSGTVGAAYTGAINASGGTAAYTFAVKVGSSLPPGLSISTAGAITGSPTTNGTTGTIIVATDANGCNGEATFTINVGCNTLAVAPASVGNGVVGTAYTPVVFNQTGGTGVITWSQTGAPPAGMSFDTGTHTLGGTPTEAGNWSITIIATDANTCAGSVNLSFSTTCPTITVNPATLPDAIVGSAYNETLSAAGGTAPYSFAVTSGTLPAGLSLVGDTIGGTSTAAGASTITITATDDNGCTGTRTLTITAVCPTITVTPASLPNGVVGTSYSQTLGATGGTAPYTFAVTSGSLPAGLGLASGTISGTPTATTAATFTITATDAHGCTGAHNFTVTPVCPTITVTPATLSDGVVGSSYSETLIGNGGTAPYSFAVTSGALPAGLGLTGDTISGTPTSTTTATFTITATDAHGCTGTKNFTVTPVCPTITVSPSALAAAVVGSAYNDTLSATGGTSPYTFAVTTGALPDGLNLAGSTISGTPTSTTSETFTITATDARGCTGTRSFTVAPTCPTITVNPASLPAAVVGTSYSQQLSATGGTAPFSYAVTTGVLPDGLALAGDTISGTPTSTTSQTFTITVTDDYGCEGTRSFTLAPTCPTISLSSTPAVLPSGTVGVAYTGAINATGGTAAYTFAVKVGSSLPDGLSISTAGAITGTPTTNGTTNTIIVATDANGCKGEATFTINIGCNTLAIAPSSVSNGVVGTAYTPVVFTQTGGTGVITWSQTGTLPAGMSFNTGTHTLSGTPTEAGNWSIVITATDANTCAGSVNLNFSTSCPTITVNPASLSAAVVGTPYTETLSATGGTAPYTFAVTSGVLPAGLGLAADTISGTPTSTTSQTFTITATDANGCTGALAFTLAPTCPTITVNPASLAAAVVGTAYSQTLSATNGTAPYTFAVTTGALPAGLNLVTDTISGTPTSTAAASFTITATDAHGCTGTRSFTVTPTCPTITVNPAALPAAVVGTSYSQTLTGNGGTAPYSFAVTTGSLPAGLSLISGDITGTPTSTTSETFTITATDAHGCTGTRSFTLAPTCPTITVNPASLPAAVVGSSYSQQLSATGGTAPHSFAVTTGVLPAGLNLIGDTISGTPTSTTSQTFTITVTDNYGCEGTRSFTLAPTCPTITLSPATLPDATLGIAYGQTLSGNGGTAPYTFAVTSGALPAGLALNAGVISGTPTSTTGGSFTITATDAHGCTGTANLSISIISSTVHGNVYFDVNGNGTQDVLEPDLADVDVVVTDSLNVPHTVTTDANGDWTIAVTPGSTSIDVDETDADFLAVIDQAYTRTEGSAVTVVNALAAQSTDAGNAGYFMPATIRGLVLADTNNDDIGDSGISGVVLTLLDGAGAIIDGDTITPGVQPITATTNGSGLYEFTNLPPGNYQISEAQPSGHASLGDRDGGDLDIIGDVVARVLDPGEVDANNNFTEEQYGSISGYVLADDDNDDIGDTGIIGVELTLLDFNGDPIDGDLNANGVQPITAITDGNGYYIFTNVPPGDYRIGEAQPAGYLSVTDADGGNVNQIGDITLVTAAPGIENANNDFIEEQPGEIRGGVFVGITPLQNVLLALFTDPNGDGDPSDGTQVGGPVQTDVNGLYAFTNVAPGNYVVVETQPSGYVSTADGDTTTPGDDVANASQTDNRIPVGIAAGETDDGNIFTEGCPTIAVNPSSLPDGTVGTAYNQTISATGGTAPYGFAVTTGTLPAGLTLSSGVISGTPSSADNQTFTITATDNLGCTGTRTYTVVTTCPTITVNPVTLSNGTVGTSYSQTLSATGGTAPYTFAVTMGTLPAGLALAGATISGTPSSPDNQTFTITVTDDYGCTGTRSYTIATTCPTIAVSPATLPDATVGTSYSQTLSGTGGNAPYAFAVTSGALPGGLSLVGNTISGTVTASGTFNFTITATDDYGCTGARALSITSTCPTITMTPATLPDAMIGASYNQTLSATGGTAPHSFAITSGTLPAGLNLVGNVISGTPTTSGSSTFTVTATDAHGCTGSRGFTVNILGGTISGTVMEDTDHDSNFTGDIPMSGVQVTLFTDPNGDGNPVDGVQVGAPAMTGAGGDYSFINLEPGDYVVVLQPISQYALVGDYDATDAQDDAFNISFTDRSIPVSVVGGETDDGNSFVVKQHLGSISGQVLIDVNHDSVGDVPAAGVELHVYRESTFLPVASLFTDSNGQFTISGLEPGSYLVGEVPPPGYIGEIDSDGDVPIVIHNINVVADQTNGGHFFVIEHYGAISGTVKTDTNNDGVGDTPNEGVHLQLLDSTGSPMPGYTASTDASGAYTISFLAPGQYRVQETQPNGYASLSDADGGNPDVVGDVTLITVVATEYSTGNDFVEAQAASIGNLVWNDTDNDGIKDAGESGIDGVVVELLDAGGNAIDSDPNTGGVQPSTSTTSGGGFYSFSNLAPGNYKLRIATPPGATPISSSVTDTNDDAIDNDDNGIQSVAGGTITSPVFALAAGENEQTIDFGLVAAGSIGNSVWHDTDGNGQKDVGENGIDGVAVALLDSLGNPVDDPNQAGVQDYVVTTSGGGVYSFSNIVPGSYQLKITTPPSANPLSSLTTGTADDQVDNDDNGTQTMPTAPVTSPIIALSIGETDNTVDFGFTGITGLYSISGQVRDDYDGDGSFSDNDGPVSGVTMELYADSNGNGSFDPGTDALVTTTTTDGFGHYLFTSLPDGTYFVQEVDPKPATSTADTQGVLNDNLVKVVISGASSIANDFLDAVDPLGYFYDAVTGEIIPGGSISVVGPGTATLLMDGSTGQYSFITDGTPGIYVMSITVPPGYMRDPSRPEIPGSFDPTGGPNPTIFGSGENPLNPGFLVDPSAGSNPYYTCFTLTPGDPAVINNNIPLVQIKPTSFVAWQYANALGGQNGGAQNPDGDRFDNLQEYAFCYAPNTGVSIGCPLKIVVNTNGIVDAKVRRATNLSDIIYTLEYIADLSTSGANGAGWTNVTTILPTVVNNGDGTETATYANLATLPGLITGKGFVRIRVDLDANHDNTPEQTTRTLASGWDTRALTVQCQTCSMPFFVCDIFSGVVDSVGSSLNVATSVGTGNLSSAFVSGKQYYLEVLSGDNAGHRFDIDEAASTATTLAISTATGNHNTLPSVPASIAGDVIAVRQHQTLDDLFVKTLFHATNNQGTADRLLFFNTATGVFDEIYWLFSNSGNPKWVLTTDAFLTDRGSRAVDPAEALYVHCRTNPVNLTFSGHVRQNSFACPLKVGSNLIGSGFPTDQSTAMRQMTVANGFTGGRDPTKTDQIRFWAGDTTTGKEAYVSHFLLEYNAYHQWSPQANASLTNENNLLMFKSLQGAFIKSIAGKSGWVLPTPWTP